MAFTKRIMLLLCFFTVMAASIGRHSMAAVYEVGDSQGWVVGDVDYNQWASSKNFQVNDSIVFNYNNKYHNVLQVSSQDYNSCTDTAPIATFNTGKDSIIIPASGDYYYLCGFPGHCQIGQKVHIHVVGSPGSAQGSVINNTSQPSAGSAGGSVDNPYQTSPASPLSFGWFSMGFLGFYFLC